MEVGEVSYAPFLFICVWDSRECDLCRCGCIRSLKELGKLSCSKVWTNNLLPHIINTHLLSTSSIYPIPKLNAPACLNVTLQIAGRPLIAWISSDLLPVALCTETLEHLDCLVIDVFDVDSWAEVCIDWCAPVLLLLGWHL
jgi:hypothetical protein